jgi:cell division protein FtsX
MIGGVYGYAVTAAVVAGLGLGCYALYQRSEAANAKLQAAEERNAQLTVAVTESEAQNAALVAANVALDATLVDQAKRRDELAAAKRRTEKELNELKKSLPKEDQDCLSRPLPESIAGKLRGSP